MHTQANQKRREVIYQVGDQLLLSTKNVRLKSPGAKKLLPKWIGPYKVTHKIGKVAYQLDLPSNLKIHDVFHVSLLHPYLSDGTVQPPPPILIEGEEEFEVDRILDHRDKRLRKGTTREYLVKWTGYGPEHHTWESEKNMQNCHATVTRTGSQCKAWLQSMTRCHGKVSSASASSLARQNMIAHVYIQHARSRPGTTSEQSC